MNRPTRQLFLLLALALAGCGTSSSGTTPGTADFRDPSYGEINQEQLRQMVEIDPADDGPFYMVNLIEFRELAVYSDGRATELTGREADALYAPVEFLRAIGAEIVFVSEVGRVLLSTEGTQWDRVAVVRYPSRALFFQMAGDPEFQARAIHKDAGVEKSLVMVAHLRDQPQPPEPDPIPHPPTLDDPALAVTHLIRLNEMASYPPGSGEPDRTGEEAMTLYEQAASPVALEQGVGPVYWFDIEGVLIGDGREFDQFRINVFPSKAAFDVVLRDPTRTAGQFHRVAAIADTYTMETRMLIENLGAGD